MNSTSVNVKVGNKLSEPIQFNVGAKQGDELSNTPLQFALHRVINSIYTYQKGTFS